jgi:cytochrome oxidase Cu insertion factor (SCO1/SenC/PrrC family)
MLRALRPNVVPILAAVLLLGLNDAAATQELQLAPDQPLSFTDADGRTVRTSDFQGKWLLVYFGYTHCADLCPTGLTAMVTALDQIGPAAAHIQPLFLTVDPERDKGPLPRKFAQAFSERLVGLGGTLEQVRQAATAFGVTFEKVAQGSSGYVVDHSSTYTLVDPTRSRAVVLRLAEPHMIAARLIDELTKAGVPLDQVNNVGAYR